MTDRATEFYAAIQDLLRLVETKINKKQYEDIQRHLEKIDYAFIQFHTLKKKDPGKFLKAFYEEGFYQKYVTQHPDFPNIKYPYTLGNFMYDSSPLRFDSFFNVVHWQLFLSFRDSNISLEIQSIKSLINKIIFLFKEQATAIGAMIYLQTITRLNQYYVSTPLPADKVLPQYLTSHRWFFDLVFFSKAFNPKLINDVLGYLLTTLKGTIDHSKMESFKDFVGIMLRDIRVAPSSAISVPFGFFGRKLNLKNEIGWKIDISVANLIREATKLYSPAKYNNWQQKFSEIKKNLPNDSEVDKILEDVEKFAQQYFLYNSLRKAVAIIGTYCVFTRRFDFVNYLITANQPLDSNAKHLNKDINPTSLEEILALLHDKDNLGVMAFGIWEGHHGFEMYYYQYLIVLVASLTRYRQRTNPEWLIVEVHQLIRSNRSIERLTSFGLEWENLSKINKQTTNVLLSVGFEVEFIESMLKPLLPRIGEVISKSLADIKDSAETSKKIEARFVINNYRAFRDESIIRNILQSRGVSIQNLNEPPPPNTPQSLSSMSRHLSPIKNHFVEEIKNEMFGGLDWYGKLLGEEDNGKIYQFLTLNSKQFRLENNVFVKQQIDKVIAKGYIILGRNIDFFEEILGSVDFTPNYALTDQSEKLHGVRQFSGMYKSNSVFNILDHSNDKSLLIFNPDHIEGVINYTAEEKGLRFRKGYHNVGYELRFAYRDKELLASLPFESPHATNLKFLVRFIMAIHSTISLKENYASFSIRVTTQ